MFLCVDLDIRRGGRHICGEDVALNYLRGGGKETWNKIISHIVRIKNLLTYFFAYIRNKRKIIFFHTTYQSTQSK